MTHDHLASGCANDMRTLRQNSMAAAAERCRGDPSPGVHFFMNFSIHTALPGAHSQLFGLVC
jgi:hypothetical protein